MAVCSARGHELHTPPTPFHSHTGDLIMRVRACHLYTWKLAATPCGLRRKGVIPLGLWPELTPGLGAPTGPPPPSLLPPPPTSSGLAAPGLSLGPLLSVSYTPADLEASGFSAEALICCTRAICRVCATWSQLPYLGVNNNVAAACSPVRRDGPPRGLAETFH